jgi:hypothetical protein
MKTICRKWCLCLPAVLLATAVLARPAGAHELENTVNKTGVSFYVMANAISPVGGPYMAPYGQQANLNFSAAFGWLITTTTASGNYNVAWNYYLDSINSTPVAGDVAFVSLGTNDEASGSPSVSVNKLVYNGEHLSIALLRVMQSFQIQAQQADQHSFTVEMEQP